MEGIKKQNGRHKKPKINKQNDQDIHIIKAKVKKVKIKMKSI